MKQLTTIIFILFFSAAMLTAQELSNIPASFVDIGFGARPVALGGAYTALANDVHSTLWNPAGMVSAKNSQASFTYTNQLGLFVYNSFSAIMPFSESQQALGIAVISSGDNALREFTVQASYGRTFEQQFKIGVTAKYRNATFGNNTLNGAEYVLFEQDEIADGLANQIKGSANGFGFDIGLQYEFSPEIKFGVMAKDVYAPVFWNSSTQSTTAKAKGTYKETLPAELAIGTALQMTENVVITSDYHPALSKTTTNALHSGIEVKLLDMIALRGGIQQIFNNDAKAKYTMGMGFDYGLGKNFRVLLDYTFMSEFLANTQRLSLGVEF